jgi:RNA polymerase sigma-70 factor (ECF subfamily)
MEQLPGEADFLASEVDAVSATSGREAVERVWREDGPRIYRSLTAFAGDADLAADAMAEAFAQALARGDGIRHADRWIWRSSFLLAKGELARRGRTRAGATEVPEPLAHMPEPVADIVAAMRTLSPNQRLAAILMLYADLPARDAARVIGCSPTTARVHLTQARRRLRPLLEDHDA